MRSTPLGKDYDFSNLKRIKVRGLSFFTIPSHARVYRGRHYEEFAADLFLQELSEGETVVDVGAYHGFYTLLAARAVGGEGRVLAFEPVTENYAVLEKNIKVNQLKNVEAHPFAVSNRPGTRLFKLVASSDSSGFWGHPRHKTLEERSVEAVRLDNYLGDLKVDVLKTDTEGSELEVLKGAIGILRRNPGIRLFVEFNPKLLKRAGYQPEDLLKFLTDAGFWIFLIDEKRRALHLLPPENWGWRKFLKARGHGNLFGVRGEVAFRVVSEVLEERVREVERLRRMRKERSLALARREREVAKLKGELAMIYRSHSWKLLTRVRGIKRFFLGR